MPNNVPSEEYLNELASGLVELHKRYERYASHYQFGCMTFEEWLEAGMPEN